MIHTIMLRELFSTYFLFPFQNLNAKNFSGTLQKKGMERLNTMAPATPLLEEAEEKSALKSWTGHHLNSAPGHSWPGQVTYVSHFYGAWNLDTLSRHRDCQRDLVARLLERKHAM